MERGIKDAGSIGSISTIPIAILYNFFVDRFIADLTVGAIK